MKDLDMPKLDERLVEYSRLSILGGLVAEVAHELNNAVTGVLGYSELVQSWLPSEQQRKLEPLAREARRTADIVRRLLAVAGREQMNPVPLDLNYLLTQTVELKSYALRVNNIRVDMQLATDLPRVVGISSQLQSVFLNLVNNAHQAMYEASQGGLLRITTIRTCDSVLVAIADDGPGVNPCDLDRVFEPFFTTKAPGSGAGLGLSISRDTISRLGGRIWVSSESGQGAAFYMELPGLKPPIASKSRAGHP